MDVINTVIKAQKEGRKIFGDDYDHFIEHILKKSQKTAKQLGISQGEVLSITIKEESTPDTVRLLAIAALGE